MPQGGVEMKKLLVGFLVLGCLMLGLAGYGHANTLYDGQVTWADSNITVQGTKWANAGTWLSWDIDDIGTKDGFILWSYSYTWHTRAPAPGVSVQTLSHLIFQVSPRAPFGDFQTFSWTLASGDPKTYTSSGNNGETPLMPSPGIFGFKVSPPATTAVTELFFYFESTHGPMWGDFYAKGNNSNVAWNAGFGTTPTGDFSNWIAVPDTKQTPVPIPGAAWLLGSGLVGLVGIRRRFKK
jgi:hypothetical protein